MMDLLRARLPDKAKLVVAELARKPGARGVADVANSLGGPGVTSDDDVRSAGRVLARAGICAETKDDTVRLVDGHQLHDLWNRQGDDALSEQARLMAAAAKAGFPADEAIAALERLFEAGVGPADLEDLCTVGWDAVTEQREAEAARRAEADEEAQEARAKQVQRNVKRKRKAKAEAKQREMTGAIADMNEEIEANAKGDKATAAAARKRAKQKIDRAREEAA